MIICKQSVKYFRKLMYTINNGIDTVVVSACWYLVICQSQCSAGDSMLSIVISMLSAIQHSPVNSDNFTWNLPNPNALTACVTVKVSEKKNQLHLLNT